MLTNNPSPARHTASGLNSLQLAMRQGYTPISKGETQRTQDQLSQLGMRQTRTNLIDFLLSHGFSPDQTNADGVTLLWGKLSSASEKNVFLLNALLFVFFFLFVFLPLFIGSSPLGERRPRGLA